MPFFVLPSKTVCRSRAVLFEEQKDCLFRAVFFLSAFLLKFQGYVPVFRDLRRNTVHIPAGMLYNMSESKRCCVFMVTYFYGDQEIFKLAQLQVTGWLAFSDSYGQLSQD